MNDLTDAQQILDLMETTLAAQTARAEARGIAPWEYALMVLEAVESDGDTAAALDTLIEAWSKSV